jgi:hypothetical protein
MKITATVSGGFAGLSETHQVDTKTKPSATAQALEKAIHEIGILEGAKPNQDELIGADMMRWKITVLDGSREQTVSLVEDGSAQIAPWKELLSQIKAAQ